MSSRKPPKGGFRNILERLSHGNDARRVFDGFTRLAACALAMQTREDDEFRLRIASARWRVYSKMPHCGIGSTSSSVKPQTSASRRSGE